MNEISQASQLAQNAQYAAALQGQAREEIDRALKSGGAPILVVPTGYDVESLERFLPKPLTIKSSLTFSDAGSLIEYVLGFSLANARLTASKNAIKVVIDAHQDGQASHESHTASFPIVLDEDFVRLQKANRAWISQESFADFMSDLTPFIQKPSAAEVLELAQELRGNTAVKWKHGKKLKDGATAVEYVEETTTSNAHGSIEVPAGIEFNLPIFKNGAYMNLYGELRFRVSQQEGLKFQLVFRRLDDVIDQGIRDQAKVVGEAIEQEPLYIAA